MSRHDSHYIQRVSTIEVRATPGRVIPECVQIVLTHDDDGITLINCFGVYDGLYRTAPTVHLRDITATSSSTAEEAANEGVDGGQPAGQG